MNNVQPTRENPFQTKELLAASIKDSTIKGRKVERLIEELNNPLNKLIIENKADGKCLLKAGTVEVELRRPRRPRDPTKKPSSFSRFWNNLKKSLSSDYEAKAEAKIKDLANKLFPKLEAKLEPVTSKPAAPIQPTTTSPVTTQPTPPPSFRPDQLQDLMRAPFKEFIFNFQGEKYIATKYSNKGNAGFSIQSLQEFNSTTKDKISIAIQPDGSISYVFVDEQDLNTTIPENKKKLVEALLNNPLMLSLQALKNTNSSKLVGLMTSKGAHILTRKDFMKNQWQIPPAILSYSEEILPLPIVQRLTHEKKNDAIGVKFEQKKKDKITNMEGALHTFLTPVGGIAMTGDFTWMGPGGVFGKNFKNDHGREVVLSALVQPDFEDGQVLMKIAEVTDQELNGQPLDKNYPFPDQKEDWSGNDGNQRRDKYDSDLQKHMIHHLTADHKLPALQNVQIMDLKFLEGLIDPNKTHDEINQALKNKAVRLNDHVISLEVMFNVYMNQVRNEMRVLESTLPQGYVYTMDPPSIFLKAIGSSANGIVFNRLNALALMCVNKETPFNNMKVFAFADFADKGMIPQLEKALPGKKVVPKDLIFKGQKNDYTYLGNDTLPETEDVRKLAEGAALVLHNNSDAFGQNIEFEPATSMDGVIGSYSSAYAMLKRERHDYMVTGKTGVYAPLDTPKTERI